MVAIGVPFIIRWENASRLRLTCRSLKDAARRIGAISDRDTLRPRCISLGADRAVNRTASSAGFFSISPSGDRVTPSAADEISAAPTIRRPYCSGNCRACANTVMPPIEWPTNTMTPARRDGLQHGFQVLAQLGQRVGLGVGLAGLAVPALVVEDHPHVRAPLPGETAAAESGRRPCADRIHGRRPWSAGRPRAVLAHRQRHPVGRRHHVAAVDVHLVEILIGIGIFVGGGTFGHRPPGRCPDDGGDRGQPGASRKPGPALAGLLVHRSTVLRPRGRFW